MRVQGGCDGRQGNRSTDTMEISELFVSILLTLTRNTRSVSSWEEGAYELCMRVGVGGPRGFRRKDGVLKKFGFPKQNGSPPVGPE